MLSQLWPSLVGSLAGFIGAATVAAAVFAGNWRKDRRKQVFDLHADYQSAAFVEARRQARELVLRNKGRSLRYIGDLEESLEAKQGELDGLLLVSRFWVRLGVAIRYRWVEEQATADLFAFEFGWWYGFIFYDLSYRPNRERRGDIHELARWFSARQRAKGSFLAGYDQGKEKRLTLSAH